MVTLITQYGYGQQENTWPRSIPNEDGSEINVYTPQPEVMQGSQLKFRAVVSLTLPGQEDPCFGTIWCIATIETDRDSRTITFLSVKVASLKFNIPIGTDTISNLKNLLSENLPTLLGSFPMDDILTSLNMQTEQKKIATTLETQAPRILYSNKPTMLVLIDGTPKIVFNQTWHQNAIVNTPYTILRLSGKYYLYGKKHWYVAPSVQGPFLYDANPLSELVTIQEQIEEANASDAGYTSDDEDSNDNINPMKILVSTEPAELIQTDGSPQMASITGTGLSYITNSPNDIFYIEGHYYILLSGRWYTSSSLYSNAWTYISSKSLPEDFSRIPEGSPKDRVLAFVAGSQEAREAMVDAQIPQTAKIDRNEASTSVTYDGDAQFEPIVGTDMKYALNSEIPVIYYNGLYYAVDKGVWFVSSSPNGPWQLCLERPQVVDLIPPSCPVYNIKYVYIYNVTPDWVYEGYTSGYLNTYIMGPTIVYGTGYHYRSWRGNNYFPRPYTWGFGMCYNPFTGWSLNYDYSYGWMNSGFDYSLWSDWTGGWWGPMAYHPPYHSNKWDNYGYYGPHQMRHPDKPFLANQRFHNNIYTYRHDILQPSVRPLTQKNRIQTPGQTNNQQRNPIMNNKAQQPYSGKQQTGIGTIGYDANGKKIQQIIQQPQTNQQPVSIQKQRIEKPVSNKKQQILSDQNGSIYQNNNGQWKVLKQNKWSPVSEQQAIKNLNTSEQMIKRGETRTDNFKFFRPSNSTKNQNTTPKFNQSHPVNQPRQIIKQDKKH